MLAQFKVVMAQVNLHVGDIESNTQLILDRTAQAIDELAADMVVFPELSLTGYPPEDLLLRPSMALRINKAIQKILSMNINAYVVIGHPLSEAGKLYNALSVIKSGELVGQYRKQYLPNYQVFDECRYFDAGEHCCVLKIGPIDVAFTICEDMWEAEPMLQAKSAGAKLLININASPYHHNKLRERQEMLKQRALQGDMPIVYVNLVGGQDELAFDGASMAVDSNGECKRLAASFSEGLYPVLIDIHGDKRCEIPPQAMAKALSVEANIYHCLVMGVRDYVTKNGFKGIVLGLSGGIDSAVSMAIAVAALGKEAVHAVMMPFDYTSQLSKSAAQQQAQTQGVHYRSISIAAIYHAVTEALVEEFSGLSEDVTEQNIQARCRAVLLMAISNKKGLLVLTTGNKSEIAVGYSTLYGDMAGGFDVLKDVPKTMVYRLAEYINSRVIADEDETEIIPQEVIDRPPSAELAADQVDQDNLPAYDVLDEILERYVELDQSATTIMAAGYDEQVVKRVLTLVDMNEYKRRQSPIGVRLTQRGFGRDRRYPITNGWPLGE